MSDKIDILSKYFKEEPGTIIVYRMFKIKI